MTGIAIMMFGGKPNPFAGLVGGLISTTARGSLNEIADSGISVAADGSLTYDTQGTSIIKPAVQSWYTPITAGIGAGYWVRLLRVSGSSPNGNSDVWNTWRTLGSSSNWRLQFDTSLGFTPGTYDSVNDLQIATDSGGANIVATARFTFRCILQN